ncbi:MIT domain-containing protein 1 [Thelohanellus kitauei]|uniref:MIT domain-containing protein 1 n=1 Tax=Thelohanellus kitauei TaxID=669202 RepID=A0A0C2M9X2_THEKT|nr:MIT domain-containing protein 1 [Thelohanellus kitauei]
MCGSNAHAADCAPMEEVTALFKKAIQSEDEQEYDQSLSHYIKGLNVLLDIIKSQPKHPNILSMKEMFKKYALRAEKIKTIQKSRTSNVTEKSTVTNIKISDGETGWDYERILSPCFLEPYDSMTVEDPYLLTDHQFANFVRLCELVLKKSQKLKSVTLYTKSNSTYTIVDKIQELTQSLGNYGVKLGVNFNENLHDRCIKFSNGYNVILGRGLDIFKALKNPNPRAKYTIGSYDFTFRECHETTITIYKNNHV